MMILIKYVLQSVNNMNTQNDVGTTAANRWQAFRALHPEASLWALAVSQAAAMLGFNVFLRFLVL